MANPHYTRSADYTDKYSGETKQGAVRIFSTLQNVSDMLYFILISLKVSPKRISFVSVVLKETYSKICDIYCSI